MCTGSLATTTVIDGGDAAVSTVILIASRSLTRAWAAAKRFVIFGAVPAASLVVGASESMRSNASTAAACSPRAAAMNPESR